MWLSTLSLFGFSAQPLCEIRNYRNLFSILAISIQVCGSTLEEMQLTTDDIPVLVDRCINFVDLHGELFCYAPYM